MLRAGAPAWVGMRRLTLAKSSSSQGRGGSCSTGRGVVCAGADDALLGGDGGAPRGTIVTPRVELVALDEGGGDEAEVLGSRVADDDGPGDTLLEEDELDSAFVGFGEDFPQSVLPLEATFCES